MVIAPKKVVSLIYQLRLDSAEGELVEEVSADEPLVFLYGAGQMIPAFEAELTGKQVGDSHAFSIPSDAAYGESDPEAIVNIPKEIFQIDGVVQEDLLYVGNSIPLQDSDGNPLQGIVVGVEDDQVTMDFNHPLAGEDLYFSVQIVEVRDATEGELDHGHVHGPDGHHHH